MIWALQGIGELLFELLDSLSQSGGAVGAVDPMVAITVAPERCRGAGSKINNVDTRGCRAWCGCRLPGRSGRGRGTGRIRSIRCARLVSRGCWSQ